MQHFKSKSANISSQAFCLLQKAIPSLPKNSKNVEPVVVMNFMNPQVNIEISKSVVQSKNQWKKAVEDQVKQFFAKTNKPFSVHKFEEALNDGRAWRLTLSGIDFNVKMV